ncbi:MAG: hypothetical protein ACSW8B_03185 [bacterium]
MKRFFKNCLRFLLALPAIIRLYFTHRRNWEKLCRCCGQCCYGRYKGPDGHVKVDRYDVCEYLDEGTCRCTIYSRRFELCKTCAKVNIWNVLFDPLMIEDCAYVTLFRFWKE